MQSCAGTSSGRLLPRAWGSWLCGVLWLGACVGGSYWAMRTDFQPGRLGPPRVRWPADSQLARSPQHTTVVAFLHPRCRCSQATVAQLLSTLTAHPGAALVVSVFAPADAPDRNAWEQGEYVKTIRAAIPHASIVIDRDGVEARRFGALTSGTILVYDVHGQERFRGGITNRRGGEEDNQGRQTLARVLAGEERLTRRAPSPVFGCPLVVDERAAKLAKEHE